MNEKQLNDVVDIMQTFTSQEQLAELAGLALLAMYDQQNVMGFTTNWFSIDRDCFVIKNSFDAKIKVDFRRPKAKQGD